MSLPYSDPSNPALPSPLFSDVTAVRGDHMRANNAAIFADLEYLSDFLDEFFTASDQLTVDEILEKTSGAGVTIGGVLCKDGVVTGDVTGNADTATQADGIKETGSGAGVAHKKYIAMDSWNMDLYDSDQVAHGLTASKIRSVQAVVFNDAGNDWCMINYKGNGGCRWDSTNVIADRLIGGHFDAAGYSSTSSSRGWFVVEYID